MTRKKTSKKKLTKLEKLNKHLDKFFFVYMFIVLVAVLLFLISCEISVFY